MYPSQAIRQSDFDHRAVEYINRIGAFDIIGTGAQNSIRTFPLENDLLDISRI